MTLNNIVTLKFGLKVTQDHLNWYQSKAWGAVSYSPSIVTMALSCIISEIKRDIGRKSSFFHTSLHSMPPLGGLCRNSAMKFGTEKLEWVGYPTVKKIKILLFVFT